MDIVVDVKKAQDKFRAAKDQIPLALSHTFNRLVYEIAVGDGGSGVLRKETDRKLDKGAERFTLSGFQYRRSTKRDLVAEAVADFTGGRLAPDGIYKTGGGSERKREYLRTILNGGTVKPVGNRQTLIEPITKNVKLNKHGNLLPSKFNKLRAQAADAKRLAPGGRDQLLVGSKTKPRLKIATKGKKKGQAVGKASQYFWGTPRNKPKTDKNYGLWERVNRSQKNPYGTGVKKIIMAGRKSRQQKRMVQGREIAHKHFMRNYNRQFLKSFAMAMRTSHQRSRVIDSFNERRKS